MADSIQDIVDSLNDFLDEERMALLDGNLDLIGRMLNRKETLIDSLNDLAKPDVKVMSDIACGAFIWYNRLSDLGQRYAAK